MYNNPLLLEGGALRGVYTSGILDVLLENDVTFESVYGVSAGVLNGINYVSRQPGRSAEVNFRYINDARYLSPRNLLHGQSIFNFDFLFNSISRELPFDYATFDNSPQRLFAVTTDCDKGEAHLFEKGHCVQFFDACAASCSMPVVSRVKVVEGINCMDGGVFEPVALYEALADGAARPVLVMTRHKGFRKTPVDPRMKLFYEKLYQEFPKLHQLINTVPERYNEMMDRIDALEAAGDAYVIRPQEPITIGHLEKNVDKLRALYNTGYEQMKAQLPELLEFCKRQ